MGECGFDLESTFFGGGRVDAFALWNKAGGAKKEKTPVRRVAVAQPAGPPGRIGSVLVVVQVHADSRQTALLYAMVYGLKLTDL